MFILIDCWFNVKNIYIFINNSFELFQVSFNLDLFLNLRKNTSIDGTLNAMNTIDQFNKNGFQLI